VLRGSTAACWRLQQSARIHRKALAPNQAGPNTDADNAFEKARENAAGPALTSSVIYTRARR
jgi:hypothetical protein